MKFYFIALELVVVSLLNPQALCEVALVEYDVSECPAQDLDPTDMGSYSHSSKCNHLRKKNKYGAEQGGEIEETVVKKAVYFSNHGRPPNLLAPDQLPGQTDTCGGSPVVAVNGGQLRGDRPFAELTETTTKFRREECVCPTLDESSPMTYIRQIVGSLLHQMGVHNHIFGPESTLTIDLRGEISHSAYLELTSFLSSSTTEPGQLQAVSEIMSNLLHTQHVGQDQPTMGFAYENFRIPTEPKFWLILLSVTLLIFVIIILCGLMIRARDSPFRLMIYSGVLFFVFSCVWIYAEMHENAKAENAARLSQFESVPRDCHYQNFTMLEEIKYYLRVNLGGYEDECTQYYRESSIDPFYQNTPVEAISEAAARLIFHPIGYVGGQIGDFLNKITEAVPFWMRPLLLILIFIFPFLYFMPHRIRTPLLSIEPVFPTPRQLEPPPQNGYAGIIVPLLRCDAATDTDDLEEFIRHQAELERNASSRDAPPSRPCLRSRPSSWHTFLKSLMRSLETFCDRVVRIFQIVLRNVPFVPESEPNQSGFLEENEIRNIEIRDPHPNREPEVAEVRIEAQISMTRDDLDTCEEPSASCSKPASRNTTSLRQSFSVAAADGNSTLGIDEGFPVDFDESTLMLDDDLLEGDVVNFQPASTSGDAEGQSESPSSRLNFQGLFPSPPKVTTFPG